MRKIIISLMMLAVLAIVGYFFASPYHTLYQIKTAVDQHDADAIVAVIDFPQVKSSVKEQLKSSMMANLANELPDDDMQMLGAMFAGAMVDGIVDVVVTPNAVTLLMDGKNINDELQKKLGGMANEHAANSQVATTEKQADSANQPSINSDDWDINTRYTGINNFAVDVMRTDKTTNEPITLLMQREGLFGWKVVDVKLPASLLKKP